MEFETANDALPALMAHVLGGTKRDSRNGATLERTFQHITLTDPGRRMIVNPERKASLPAQIAESVWLLAGRDDIEWLSHYLPRAKDFSDDGSTWRGAYGARIRRWGAREQDDFWSVDQLKFVVELLKRDPETRQAVMAIYDPVIDSQPGKDIPCNNWLHFLQRDGSLDLHVVIRSNDLMWGWSGINAFEWSVLLEVVAGLTGHRVGKLHFSISSLHLYEQHWAKAKRIGASPQVLGVAVLRQSPEFSADSIASLDSSLQEWFRIEEVLRLDPKSVKANSHLIGDFREPMLRSWLLVIAWWWSGDNDYLLPLHGTDLRKAALLSPNRPRPRPAPGFTEFVANLHAEKHAVYKDSWKKRGEHIGILANIARKVDRLGEAGGGDTSADTAVDLLVYLIKYRLWLTETAGATPISDKTDHVEAVTSVLFALWECNLGGGEPTSAGEIRWLKDKFENLEQHARSHPNHEGGIRVRAALVDQMIPSAHLLAHALWKKEK